MESLSVNKKAAWKFNTEKFNLSEATKVEVKEQYQLKISNRFAALQNLSNSRDINRPF
jgi:hypothetical protein